MRLTPIARGLAGLLAIANLWLAWAALGRGEWFTFGLSLLMAALLGVPAILGRAPFAQPERAPRWLVVREPAPDHTSAPAPR